MKLKKFVCTFIVLNLLNMAVLPTFAITENSNAGISTKQEKMLKHKTKRSKKYNDDYKYAYVNLDFWKGFNDENLNNYINLAIKNNYDNG